MRTEALRGKSSQRMYFLPQTIIPYCVTATCRGTNISIHIKRVYISNMYGCVCSALCTRGIVKDVREKWDVCAAHAKATSTKVIRWKIARRKLCTAALCKWV